MNLEKAGYIIRDQSAMHFVTFTVVDWIDLFSRKEYRDIIVENLDYCRRNKGLLIHAYVIMSNHIHLMLTSESGKLSDTIRDFKGYTSKLFIDEIKSINESRRDWLLNHFSFRGTHNTRNEINQIWTNENHPEECYSLNFMKTKVDYIHNNPVRAGWVQEAHEYLYSSAKNYAGMEGLIKVDLLW